MILLVKYYTVRMLVTLLFDICVPCNIKTSKIPCQMLQILLQFDVLVVV